MPESRCAELLGELGNALAARFDETGQIQDLNIAILLQRKAVGLLSHSPVLSDSLDDLAVSLSKRFSQTGQVKDLNEAIQMFREALKLRPLTSPDRCITLNNLATALGLRYDRAGRSVDIEEVISLFHEGLKLLPSHHHSRASVLTNLGTSLQKRFLATNKLTDLDDAVISLREALRLSPAPNPNRSATLSGLGTVLSVRFTHKDELADVDEAIVLHRESLRSCHPSSPYRFIYLNNLTDALEKRWKRTGHQADFKEIVPMQEESLKLLPAPHPSRPQTLSNLGYSLLHRFEQDGQLVDLDRAVALHREALELCPSVDPARSYILNTSARILSTRFDQTGHRVDMDEAIVQLRQVYESIPGPFYHTPQAISNLASALETRFHDMHRLADLDEAIALYREALLKLSTTHPSRSDMLVDLAAALGTRFGETKRSGDLNEAISLHREALALRPPEQPGRERLLSTLAVALGRRFTQTGQLADLDEAITLYRESQSLRPDFRFLNNLANGLRARFERLHVLADLEEAITVYRKSVDGLASDHPSHCQVASNLAVSYMQLYSVTKRPEYLDEAMTSFRAAVECKAASPLLRFRSAKSWAHYANANRTPSAMEAYQAAIQLLPSLATLDQNLESRQEVLKSWSDGLARNAAACAISLGQFGKAIELLEQGRAIFWSQALQLRTSFDDLKSVKPELARKLERIAHVLDKDPHVDNSRIALDPPKKSQIEEQVARHRRLNEDWLATLENVRKLKGFEDFLRTKSLSTLQQAACNGPIVMLNASESACSALVMTQSGVDHIPIPTLTLQRVASLAHLTRIASASSGRSPLSESALMNAKALIQEMAPLPNKEQLSAREDRGSRIVTDIGLEPDEIFQTVLAILWISVAEPVVRSLKLQKTESPSRLWWCPTGPFAFLPMHAAGMYDVPNAECISDYAISSYTPTINALLAQSPAAVGHPVMLAVIQPKTKGHSSLPHTEEELRKIELHVPRQSLIKLGVPEAPASVEKVLAKLTSASIVHLACHGVQHPENPLESAVHLDDGQLKVSQIMKQPLPSASLAFLSACQTAMGNKDIPDEVIHLAATLLFAGFRGTVATMWSMADIDGPTVADHFYGYLFKDRKETEGPVDITQAAHALHYAVAKLRASGRPFASWVPFIHLGV